MVYSVYTKVSNALKELSERDRLRAVECPSDIIDAIGGWTTTGVGQRYGTGQPLEVKAKWMGRLVDQD